MSDQTSTGTRSRGVAVVTGGGRGIGRAVAAALHADGWSVVVAGRTRATLESTVASLGDRAVAVVADVAEPDQVSALFDAAVERFGSVDLLFNNAGISAPAIPIDELDIDTWNRVVAVNLTGSFLCARAAFARMRLQPDGGRIINNGSVSSTTPRPFSAPYTATKHAITGLTKSLALDGRSAGVRCGQIDVGNAGSDMGDKMAEGALQPDGSIRAEPIMAVHHVAEAVVYMASLPPEANVLFLTVMASGMPFVGRG